LKWGEANKGYLPAKWHAPTAKYVGETKGERWGCNSKKTILNRMRGLVGKRLRPQSVLGRGSEVGAFTSCKKPDLIILFYILNKILYEKKRKKAQVFDYDGPR